MSAFTDKIESLLVGAYGTDKQKQEVWQVAQELDAVEGHMGDVIRSHYVAWVTNYRYLVTIPPADHGLPETVIVSDNELALQEGLRDRKSIERMQELRYDASQKRINRCVDHLQAGWGDGAICFVCSREEWRRAKELAGYQEA